ncbi:MAG: DMT family transporter [Prolixibacteraceae bacterium]|jgi:drug/metabolite transporter (DMT)-like permease|nr:DMT family transporter [Prolixibacteraceae bacterium]
MKNLSKQTVFLAIVACLLWSSAFAGVKIGLRYHTPLQFAGIRFFIAGLMLVPVIGSFPRYWKETRENFGFVLLIALLQVVLQYSLFYMGISLLPGSISAMVIGSSPLFIAILSHYTIAHDKMDRLKLGSIFLGITGVAIISMRKQLPSGAEISLTGIFILIMNNIVSGVSNVVIAQKKHSISPLVLTSSSLILGGLILFGISVPVEGMATMDFPAEYFIALGWLSFLSAAAISIWNTLLRRPGVKVSDLNIWKFLIPVSGAILSWTLLANESPDLVSIIGMLVIASSLLLLNYPFRKKKA